MFFSVYLKILNGIQINYGFNDLLAFIKFIFKRYDPTLNTKVGFSDLKVKVVIISLPFRHDRRSHIVEQFKSLNINFEFYDAIHGKSQSSIAFDKVQFSRVSKKYLSSGNIGCIASHFEVWKELAKSSCDGYLIFEDDVNLKKNLSELGQLLREYPKDADIIYLGSGSIKSWPNMIRISKSLSKVFSIRKGAYSYFLFKNGALKLLKSVKKVKIVCGGIDSILGVLEMRRELIAYHLNPAICDVDYSFTSNIINISNKSKIVQETEYK